MRISRRDLLFGTVGAALASSCSPIKESVCCTSPTAGCLAPVPFPVALLPERCELFAFDEVQRATPTVYRPRSTTELADLVKSVPDKRTLSFRGGGQSLDSQSLNDDVVVQLDPAHFG